MSINGTRWKIGWSPKGVILGGLVVGGIVGALADAPGAFAFIGLLVGVGAWFWGRSEVNSKYVSLLEDFRDASRSQVERETGGMELSSAHTFISASGSSPTLIKPARTYSTSHLLFGDTSVVVNRQYKYDMKERTQLKGGKQQEVFYDQISNVQSEDYNNYAELEISLSSGDTERIRGRDTAGINEVKSDLQQKMREARRGARRPQEPGSPAPARRETSDPPTRRESAGSPDQTDDRGSERAGDRPETTGQRAQPSDAETNRGTAAPNAESDAGPVSTDWLTDAETTLCVRNDASGPRAVRIGCRVDGERQWTDDVRLDPGETADWDDTPDDSRFEVAVVVLDGGPTAGKRFDPGRDPPGEIRVSITDSDVVFGDWDDSEWNDPESARSGSSSADASSRGETASSEGTSRTASTPSQAAGAAGAASSATRKSAADAASGTSAGSSDIASEVFEDSGASDGGAASAREAAESWESAEELADAVQQSASRERVEQLASFLDAPAPSERRAAIRGLRQSVRKCPEPIAASTSSVAALLDDADGETRQEAAVTLQRLAESHSEAVADATHAIVDRLSDENPKVRIAACRTLDAIGADAGAEKLEELADEDSHKGVQVAAFHALESVGK